MKKIRFDTTIAAPREVVWDVMLGADTYREWTAPFAEGSYFEGSWDEGAAIRFLGPGGGEGMVAVIAKNRRHEFVSIEHRGFIKDGVEDTTSEAVRAWAPAFENYTLRSEGTGTRLEVEMDVLPDFEEYMAKTWPQALSALKALSETRAKAS
jgi:uncharacterized protein YndB with AHSA1/START domain